MFRLRGWSPFTASPLHPQGINGLNVFTYNNLRQLCATFRAVRIRARGVAQNQTIPNTV